MPDIKHHGKMNTKSNSNSSVSGSQDDSEGEPPLPLPTIKQCSPNNKQNTIKGVKKAYGYDKYAPIKVEFVKQPSIGKGIVSKKKFHEDLKVDKARIIKKSLIEGSKNPKKRK